MTPEGTSPAGPSGDEEPELLERLRELLTAARAEGLLDRVRPLLVEFLADEPKAAPAPESDVPRRFGMVGKSPAMEELFSSIERVARSDVPVLIQGETGTGKELVARAVHDASSRAKKPFVAENCAAVAPTLLESELFGHKRGSFTGAVADRDGCFVTADGGTIFLDELGDMPLEMQAKLLRVLEEGEVRPVGSNRVRHVDVRVVAATNKDLEAMVAEGSFRQDLFYRLNVVNVTLPPLRERRGDVRHLVRFLLEREAARAGGEPQEISEEALVELESRSWPGNVRQLENEIRRAVAMSRGTIEASDLSAVRP